MVEIASSAIHTTTSLTHAQTTALRSGATAVLTAHGTPHLSTCPSRDGLPCAQDSLVARVQRSISLSSRRITYHARITCPTASYSSQSPSDGLGEVRPPISTPVRLFPAVGRWGSVSTSLRIPSRPQRRRRRSSTKISAQKKKIP